MSYFNFQLAHFDGVIFNTDAARRRGESQTAVSAKDNIFGGSVALAA